MKNQRNIQVLSAFRPYLSLLQSYNVESFRGKCLSNKIRQVGWVFFVSIILTAALLVALLSIWHMSESSQSVSEFSTSFAMTLAYVQMFLTGISIIGKNRMITRALNDIQKIVDERKFNMYTLSDDNGA